MNSAQKVKFEGEIDAAVTNGNS